ncbi:MAG TPA: SIS domain-containing protein [Candidatus Limnocylindrales bacterium]|nr:SIS domain-containing protein [Candidatus Limnocylindrales bacterium]
MTTPADTQPFALDRFVGWRESATSGEAIAAALAAARTALPAARDLLAGAERVVVTGAGSSYYLAQTVAAAARDASRRSFAAAPLSELILRPDGVLDAGPVGRRPIIVISRSGSTSEALAVVEQMRALGHPTIAVTCRPESPLAALADVTLVSPAGDEEAIVMTRSFASMLALLLRLIADVAGADALARGLDELPDRWTEAADAAETGRRLGATDWSRVVILGGGPSAGIAAEWGLKLTETSQVPTLAFEPLEFRHGPISVCEPGVLVVGLIAGAGAADEVRVIEEAGRLGASTWVVARDRAEAGSAGGDVSLIGGGLDAAARLPLLLHPAHALAFRLAVTRGCDPDRPRHLGQVVIIDAP